MSTTDAINVAFIFRDRCREVRRQMLKGEIGEALAMLEMGTAYIEAERLVSAALVAAPPEWHPQILKAAERLRALARAMVDVPEVGE